MIELSSKFMGRPQQFDQSEVLGKALFVFWQQGYTATSMTDLLGATELKPGSLYHGFGNKKGLFLQVIDYYLEQVVDLRIQTYLYVGEPISAIESYFTSAFEVLPAEQLQGCLLTNTATEMSDYDEDINAAVKKGLLRIEKAFETRLLEAEQLGLLAKNVNPKDLAVHLLSCFQGLGVIGRLTKDKARLRVITEYAMQLLRQ